jgi:hypothetical protein
MPNDPKEFTQNLSEKLYVEDIRPLLQLKESQSLVHRLKTRATIRRNIKTRKSVREGKPDRLADLLEEAAKEIEGLQQSNKQLRHSNRIAWWVSITFTIGFFLLGLYAGGLIMIYNLSGR